MPKPYHPINCEDHDELELLCLRKAERLLRFHDGDDIREAKIRFEDLLVTKGEEFLVCRFPDGTLQNIRLDRLMEITPA